MYNAVRAFQIMDARRCYAVPMHGSPDPSHVHSRCLYNTMLPLTQMCSTMSRSDNNTSHLGRISSRQDVTCTLNVMVDLGSTPYSANMNEEMTTLSAFSVDSNIRLAGVRSTAVCVSHLYSIMEGLPALSLEKPTHSVNMIKGGPPSTL